MTAISSYILQQNHHWLILNKPPGMPVQPDQTGDANLLTAAQAYCKRSLHVLTRLDRPASGLVLMSKTSKANRHFHELQSNHTLTRKYWAITAERPESDQAEVKGFIQRTRGNRSVWVSESSNPADEQASLRYSILEASERYFLWEIELFTGRHHQIRAFLQFLNCPIRGDVKYGYKRSNPQHHIQLHAREMQFDDLDGSSRQVIIAPTPEDTIWSVFSINQPK